MRCCPFSATKKVSLNATAYMYETLLYYFFSLLANVNNIRSNTKGMTINIERLADSVSAIEERQDQSAKSNELIHILVSITTIVLIIMKFLSIIVFLLC